MANKLKRIGITFSLAALIFLIVAALEVLAELYLPESRFLKIMSFTFASSSVLVIVATVMIFMSLAWNDYQESKSTSNMVALGENDRVIAVHKIGNAVVHLPVNGTVQQAIVAPSGTDLPYVSSGTLEHVHVEKHLPPIELMNDEVYDRLFGLGNREKEKS